MKSFTLSLILISCIYPYLYSQSLILSNNQGAIPNNSDVFVLDGGDVLTSFVFVSNNSASDMQVHCCKTELSIIPGTNNSFCWGVCFAPQMYCSVDPVPIAAGATDFVDFAGDYYCQGNVGISIIRYTFFDANNTSDSVCFNVHYNGCNVGEEEFSVLSPKLELSPNPASSVCDVTYIPA